MSTKKYSSILFDLDHTLWDYETNSEETLRQLFDHYRLHQHGATFRFFRETFQRINRDLWDRYDRGLIGQHVIRTERFQQVFEAAGVEQLQLASQFSVDYLAELPKKENLIPHAREILEYLHERYPMIIVTNGWEDIQETKLRAAGIRQFFKHVVTSQRAGNKKPSEKIFQFALSEGGLSAIDSIMIGDNLKTDIAGARAAMIDAIFFNPMNERHDECVTHEIRSLVELKELL